MKKSMLKNSMIIILSFIALTFTGCDLFNKADDISFNTTLIETIAVVESATADNKAYEKVITLSATTDPEIDKYKNKIKSFKVNSVTYTIKNFTASADVVNLTNAKFSFSDTDATSAEVIANIDNTNLGEASSAGTTFTLAVDDAGLTKIGEYLKSDKAVKIYLNGTLSSTPVSFDVDITLDVTVQADVL